MQFILQLGLLVLAARLGGVLFRAWKLPSMLGELAAGILIGPHVLGSLPGAPLRLVSDAADMGSLSDNGLGGVIGLALMVLLFLVGLESDLRMVRRYSASAVLVGAAGMLAALVAGAGAIVLLAPSLLHRTFGWCEPETALAAVAAAVTSIGLVARSLSRARRLETPESRIVLSGAPLDNLLAVGLLVVACGLGLNVADGQPATAGLAWMLLKALLVGVAIVAITIVAARRLERFADPDRNTTDVAVYGLGCALLAGGACWCLGLTPLLGAYVLGVALAATDLRHQIQERLDFLHAAFIPACFAFVGARVDPALMVDPSVLTFALLFLLAVLLAQTLGVSVLAWFAGLNGRGCCRAGASLLPRGEMTLAVILAALALEAMPAELLAAVVLLLLVAGAAAPMLTAWAFAHGGAGTRRGFSAPESLRLNFRFPSHQAARLVLSRLIELFEDEGFYVSLLNRREVLYQFARESSVISVQRAGGEIVFTCEATDRDLVYNAMLEVAAGVEQGMRELREPLDAMTLRQRLQEEASTTAGVPAATAPNAALRPFLTAETMQPHLRADSKAGVIAELLDLLHSRGLVRDRDAAARAVFEREQSLPTGLQNGVAIPHGRTDAVDRLVCAVGLKPEGVDFEALDGRPARIVVLVLAPLHAAAPHLRFLALVGQALHEQGRAALLACDTAEDMYTVLAGVARSQTPRDGGRAAALQALAWQSISLDLRASTREEALDQLLALCARSGAVSEPDQARLDVFARAGECAVGFEHGVALPHARTSAADRMVCAFGISREGIDCGAADGEPARIFIMVLAPPSATTEYTRLMGVMTRALDAEGRQALLAARSSQDVLAILAARGSAG